MPSRPLASGTATMASASRFSRPPSWSGSARSIRSRMISGGASETAVPARTSSRTAAIRRRYGRAYEPTRRMAAREKFGRSVGSSARRNDRSEPPPPPPWYITPRVLAAGRFRGHRSFGQVGPALRDLDARPVGRLGHDRQPAAAPADPEGGRPEAAARRERGLAVGTAQPELGRRVVAPPVLDGGPGARLAPGHRPSLRSGRHWPKR